jgi:hypothetical protein
MLDLTRTQREVINHIVAENEGRPWGSRIAKYIHAFSGRFLPDMAFTFYFMSAARPIMYVYDPQNRENRSSRKVFQEECDKKKAKLLEITGFFKELTEKGYVRRYYRGLQARQPLPEGYDTVWRKYSDFYSNVTADLAFVCLADFTPKLKLYKLWKNMINK